MTSWDVPFTSGDGTSTYFQTQLISNKFFEIDGGKPIVIVYFTIYLCPTINCEVITFPFEGMGFATLIFAKDDEVP